MKIPLNDRELRLEVTPAALKVTHAPDYILVGIEMLLVLCTQLQMGAAKFSGHSLYVGDEVYEIVEWDSVDNALLMHRVTPAAA